jgi:hypothetical protein
VSAEQAAAERVAAEQAEAERVAAEQAEAERVAAEQAEAAEEDMAAILAREDEASEDSDFAEDADPHAGEVDDPSLVAPSALELKLELGSEPELMTVECPDGCGPGDYLEVMSPRGIAITVAVPQGVLPGDAFECEVPADHADSIDGTGETGLDKRDDDEEEEEERDMMMIECPDGSGPGDLILIEGPDGEDVEVTVPDGVGPGDTFHYDLNLYAEGRAGDDEASSETDPSAAAGLMMIECPDGSGAGDLILIEGLDGEDVEVIVPDGVGAGDTFQYDLSEESRG